MKAGQRRASLSPRSGQRVEALLRTARDVFSEMGFEKATTLEIAQRLAISEATVFTYFGSKRELCMQVLQDWYGEISTELEREVPMVEGTRARLFYIVRHHLNQLLKDGKGLCALVLSEGRSADAEFAAAIATLKRRYTTPLTQVLADAQASGEIRCDVPLRLYRDMIYGTMEHVLWDGIVSRQTPDIDQTAGRITDLLWRAMLPVDVEYEKLRQFHASVMDAGRHLKND